MTSTSEIIDWRDLKIEIQYEEDLYSCGILAEDPISHLQLRCIKPEKSPLPMSRTGYRSHHVPTREIKAHGGAISFAIAWLDYEAESQQWKDMYENSRQMDLF